MANDEGNSELHITPDQPNPSSSKSDPVHLHLVSWSAGFVLAVFAIAAVLLAFRVPSALTAAWSLLSIAMLVISEGDGLQAILNWDWQTPDPGIERTFAQLLSHLEAYAPEEAKPLWPVMRNLRTRRFTEAFAALVLAALSLLSSPLIGINGTAPAPNRGIPPELTQRLDRIENEVTKCHEERCAAQVQPTPNNGDNTVRFDPEIRKALLDFLQSAAAGFPGKSPMLSFSWPLWIVIGLLAAIAVGILILIFRKHPEAAPPLGAAGLAGAVIAKTSQFSHFDHEEGWALLVLALFGVATLALAAWFFQQIRKEPATAMGKDDPRLKSFASLWLTLFSVFVLLWVLVLVCFQPAENKSGGIKTPPPALTELKIDDKLPTISGFVSNTKDEFPNTPTNQLPSGVEQALLARLQQDAPANGAVLLLLGSADCVHVRGKREGNNSLAQQRADWVSVQLQSKIQALGITPQPQAISTHEACRQEDGMRAVYPILIQIKPATH